MSESNVLTLNTHNPISMSNINVHSVKYFEKIHFICSVVIINIVKHIHKRRQF